MDRKYSGIDRLEFITSYLGRWWIMLWIMDMPNRGRVNVAKEFLKEGI
jgi:hypothetical protein